MIDRLKQLFAPPVYEEEDRNHKSRLLNIILIAVIVLLTLLWISRLVTGVSELTSSNSLILGAVILFLVGVYIATRFRYLQFGVYALLSVTWLATTMLAWNADGVKDSAFMAYMVIILVASLLSGWRAALFVIGITIAAGWGLVYAESTGLLLAPESDPSSDIMTDYSFILGLSGVMIYLLVSNLQNALRDARQSNLDLRALSQQLEVQVSERTQALETSINISRHLTTILDQKELAAEVVKQVRSAFNYYHAQIYLFDESGQNLVMVGGTGEAGQALLAQGHKIGHGQGLVGQAATNNRVVLVPDTKAAVDWLPNPLLPETKAEIAIPIELGGQVLGVLDVQHNVTEGLTSDDAQLLQSVADQVAIALRNARTYEKAQSGAEQEAIVNRISQRIQTAMDIESVLQIAAQELGQALSTRRATVQISRITGENGRSPERN